MSEWIEADKRMPLYGETVLAYGPEFGHEIMSNDCVFGWWPVTEGQVTHWMPLPKKPPKDSK